MLNNPIVLYALVFAAALLLVDTVLRGLFAIRRSNSDVASRLEELKLRKGTNEAYREFLKLRGMGRRNGEQSVGNRLDRFVGQSGIEMKMPQRIMYLVALFLLGLVLASFILGVSSVWRYPAAVAFALLSAFSIVYIVRDRRIRKFTSQLPDAIDIIVRSLNAGHPLTAAIALVAREMPDPIGSEFGVLSDQLTFGSELDQAMLSMYERVGAPELNLLAVTVSVQRGTGGNLSEILENLAQMVRDRLMLRNKIRAISAEGRITAWIMLLFPFGLYYMILFLVPEYYDPVWESGYGTYVVVGCLAGIFMGMIVIRRLVNFDF